MPIETHAAAKGYRVDELYSHDDLRPTNNAPVVLASKTNVDAMPAPPAKDVQVALPPSAPASSSGGPGGMPTDLLFAGQRWDSGIGLYQMGDRWYDPALGRFVSPDSIVPQRGNPQALNRYSYAANNPLKYTDPGGHCWGIASGIRGLPSYGTTCNNLDMALTIVQSPKTSAGEKVGAGAYIVGEGGAHVALAAGSAGLACAASGPGCVAAVEGALGIGTKVASDACADGNCTNEIELSAKLGRNVWQMAWDARGQAIEQAIGRSPQLTQNFPTIDRFENGVATSIKSIDLGAQSYQSMGGLASQVQGYINSVANFNGARWGGVNIDASMITGRQLILAIPPGATAAQMAVLQQLQAAAANQGVTMVLQVVK